MNPTCLSDAQWEFPLMDEIDALPVSDSEYLSAYMQGVQDAESGEDAKPENHYMLLGDIREYCEGYESVAGPTRVTSVWLRGVEFYTGQLVRWRVKPHPRTDLDIGPHCRFAVVWRVTSAYVVIRVLHQEDGIHLRYVSPKVLFPCSNYEVAIL